MKKVTIISGPPASGKTTLAKKLCKNKKAVWMDGWEMKSDFRFRAVEPDTEVIVIEMDSINEAYLGRLKMLVTSTHITVNKIGKQPFKMERPEMIIIAQRPILSGYRKYIREINLEPFDVKEIIQIDETRLDKKNVIENIKSLTHRTTFKFGKSFFFLFIALLPLAISAQVIADSGMGYDISTNKGLIELSAGYELKNIRIEGQMTPTITRDSKSVNFFGAKIGYDIDNFFTPSVGYYYNLVNTDNGEFNKNYVGYSAKVVMTVHENGGLFINGMLIDKQCLVTAGFHFIF